MEQVATMMIYSEQNSQLNTVEPLLMATPDECTHLGSHCIEIVLIKPLICGHPSIMAEIFGSNGGHYRRVPLYA